MLKRTVFRLIISYAVVAALFMSVDMRATASAYEQEVKSISRSVADKLTEAHRLTLAVLDFTDIQGAPSPLGKFLAQEVSAALSNFDEGFRVVDRNQLQDIIEKNKLSASSLADPGTTKRFTEIVGTDALLVGTVTPLTDSVRLSVKLIDCGTANVIGAASGHQPGHHLGKGTQRLHQIL
jgi:TolB-like protein